MKAIVPASAALLLLAGACTHEDTSGGGMWVRTIEPRLTTTSSWHVCTQKLPPGHVVADAQCAAGPIDRGFCEEEVDSREQANRMLVSQAQCTDASIAALERFSHADAAALSDLAGAYYVRAQRKDNPADLLRAFEAARRAVAMRPQPAGAQFNLALILEALSLNGRAIDAWQRAEAVEGGQWSEEARAHRLALMRAAQDGEHQWEHVSAGIDAALVARDAGKARQLIAAFPAASQRYFEENVLVQWASSPSPFLVSRVVTFGKALSQFFNDRYFADVAGVIVKARAPGDLDRLREGHRQFAKAREKEANFEINAAASLYAAAARLLQRAGSPQSLLARIGYTAQNAVVTSDYGRAVKELDAIAADARQYPSVVARVNLNRINADQFSDGYNDLFTAYDAASATYGRISDWEDQAAADARVIPAMSVVGLKERAWRQAFAAIRDAPRLLNLKTRYLLMGVTSYTALDLDHPEAALLYSNVVVDFCRRHPACLVSALDHLAAIEIRLRRNDAAQQHLDEAIRRNSQEPRLGLRGALEARLLEVQGEMAMRVDPRRAIGPLTQAINAASKAEFKTFTAALFARRADAYARVGNPAQAEADRREALKRLHDEEELMLSGRKRGTSDDLWNSYFSRFDETYDLLIRQLIDDGKLEEAFQYAERARAFEPLDLVRRLSAAPAAFRDLAASSDNVDIAKLRAVLQAGTYLVEYRVFDDQTYAWILGRDVFVGQQLTARRSDVKRWTAALQNAASSRDLARFDHGLEPPYDGLLKTPLEIINRLPGGAGANIVIVPDRELRGLPFAALRNPDTKRYVIEDHVLSISGSALLYAFAVLRDRDLPRGDASALLIGDPAFDQNSTLAAGLPRLAFAKYEAEHIRPLYPHSEVLTGDAATPQRFLRMVAGNAIIDIAAHAVINGDAPSQSFLLFAASGEGSGVLNAETLMKELHTDKTRLVVLGACSSAGGLPVGAEGIAPLVRPIIGAGVPGVIGSLWDINDATAAKLLVSFHGNYRKGSDAATALRDAQLEMLGSSNLGERSGLSWAPFEAIGYASSPFVSIENMTKEKPP